MELALLIDFGSTYTKVTAVDLQGENVVGTARAFSTVSTNITEGLCKALKDLEGRAGLSNPQYRYKLACSSAAGGLRMIAVGLIPELTVEAAKRAALGAGARVIDVFAHELTKAEVGKIEEQQPDIILLAGGTDGGNRGVILHNARALAGSMLQAPVVMAGNKSAGEEVCSILALAGKDVRVTENVMPELNLLNINPARKTIRALFLERIVAAKGLQKAEQLIDRVVMPTPAAVLAAAQLLSEGSEEEEGLGDLVVVDVGGATTDVYSVAGGEPTKAGVSLRGLPEPFAKRTVEGDLGMRYSAQALLETVGVSRLQDACGRPKPDILNHVHKVAGNPAALCQDPASAGIEEALAYAAVDVAVERHVGKIEVVYTPFGMSLVQKGKDLTQTGTLVGTGGVIVFHPQPGGIMKAALFDRNRPEVLKPMHPETLIDQAYILAGMGLLSEVNPRAALSIMKKSLKRTEPVK